MKGHLNRITGSRVTAIFLEVWILPFGGAPAVEGLLSTGPTPSSLLAYASIYIYISGQLPQDLSPRITKRQSTAYLLDVVY